MLSHHFSSILLSALAPACFYVAIRCRRFCCSCPTRSNLVRDAVANSLELFFTNSNGEIWKMRGNEGKQGKRIKTNEKTNENDDSLVDLRSLHTHMIPHGSSMSFDQMILGTLEHLRIQLTPLTVLHQLSEAKGRDFAKTFACAIMFLQKPSSIIHSSAMSSTSSSPAGESIAGQWNAAITATNWVRGSEYGFPLSKAVPQFKASFHSEPVLSLPRSHSMSWS